MLRGRTVRRLLERCVMAQLRVDPVPRDLSQSLGVYSQLGKLPGGAIVSFKQDQCPVTKQRLENVRVVFEDTGRSADGPAGPAVGTDGSIVSTGRPAPTTASGLTGLEKALLALDSLELDDGSRCSVQLLQLSRNERAVRMARDVHVTSQLRTNHGGNLREATAAADQQFEQQVGGISELFRHSVPSNGQAGPSKSG